MSNEAQVMREFLVSLGFVINQPSEKKFTGTLEKTTKLAMSTGKAVLSVGVAAQAMVALFTSNMEKMYYASRRTGASVDNLQAAEYGFKNIGLEAGAATSAVESMAAAIRMNPGLRGALNNMLGKDTSGMDSMEAMLELVQKLANLPHNVGAQKIGLFGIDEKTFLMLKQGMPELLAAMEKRKQLARDAGLDPDAAAKASKEYQNMWRSIIEKLDIVASKWSVEILPYAKQFAGYIDGALDRLSKVSISQDLKDMMAGYERLFGDKSKPLVSIEKVEPTAEQAKKPWYQREFDDIKSGARNLKKWFAGDKSYKADGVPTVTDDDKSVAPGKIDIKNMTKDQERRWLALAAKQFDPALRGRWTGGMSTQYADNAPTAANEQRAILNQELLSEKDPKNRERLQRALNQLGAPTAPAAAASGSASNAGPKVEITQTNNIKVDGGGNANDVDTRMKSVLDRANADMIRNMGGATR